MVCENIGYDMESMPFDQAISRALDDLNLGKEYAEDVANLFYEWEADKANK